MIWIISWNKYSKNLKSLEYTMITTDCSVLASMCQPAKFYWSKSKKLWWSQTGIYLTKSRFSSWERLKFKSILTRWLKTTRRISSRLWSLLWIRTTLSKICRQTRRERKKVYLYLSTCLRTNSTRHMTKQFRKQSTKQATSRTTSTTLLTASICDVRRLSQRAFQKYLETWWWR